MKRMSQSSKGSSHTTTREKKIHTLQSTQHAATQTLLLQVTHGQQVEPRARLRSATHKAEETEPCQQVKQHPVTSTPPQWRPTLTSQEEVSKEDQIHKETDPKKKKRSPRRRKAADTTEGLPRGRAVDSSPLRKSPKKNEDEPRIEKQPENIHSEIPNILAKPLNPEGKLQTSKPGVTSYTEAAIGASSVPSSSPPLFYNHHLEIELKIIRECFKQLDVKDGTEDEFVHLKVDDEIVTVEKLSPEEDSMLDRLALDDMYDE